MLFDRFYKKFNLPRKMSLNTNLKFNRRGMLKAVVGYFLFHYMESSFRSEELLNMIFHNSQSYYYQDRNINNLFLSKWHMISLCFEKSQTIKSKKEFWRIHQD